MASDSERTRRHSFIKGRALEVLSSFEEREFTIFFGGSFAFFLGMSMHLLLRNIVVFNLTDSAFYLSISVIVAIAVLPIT